MILFPFEIAVYESEAGRHFVGGQDENLDSGPGLVTPAEVVSATAVKDPSSPIGTGVSVASDDSQLLYPSAVGINLYHAFGNWKNIGWLR